MGNPVSMRRSSVGLRTLSVSLPRVRGFTLVELVMVILLLGIMATFSSQFIGLGTQIYGDASRREQLMGDARFALERLNRELRDAVPGSVRVEDKNGVVGNCLYFWPIATSSRYLALNLAQSGAIGLTMVAPETSATVGDWSIVNPNPVSGSGQTLDQGCQSGNCVATVIALGTTVSGAQTLTVDKAFAGDSPAKRIYFANRQVRYCVEGSPLTLTRASVALSLPLPASGALMAEHIRPAAYYFYQESAAFNSEGEFGMRFVFERNGETVTFNHKVEVLNVP